MPAHSKYKGDKMTIRIRKPTAGKSTAVICNYVYCATTKRSKPIQHCLLQLNSDPAALPIGVRLTSTYQLTPVDIGALREWLLRHGTFKAPEGYEELSKAYDLLYEQLKKYWVELTGNDATQKDFAHAWRRVQLIQDSFKNRLQELGAVKKMNKSDKENETGI
jgi:hypothetical protein